MNRKRVILGVLLGVLMLCLLYAYTATPRLEKAPPRVAGERLRPKAKAAAPTAKKGQERIDFAFLTSEPGEFNGAERDIFHFEAQRPVRTSPVAPSVASQPIKAVVILPTEAMAPMEVVQKSLAKFTFLGFLEKGGEKTVFLSSGGKLFLVKRGESFGADQEFRVADIKGNLLQVRHPSRDGLIEIPLIEQQKLSASVSSPARVQPAPAGFAQPKARALPNRRVVRPATGQEGETPLPELNGEVNPEEAQGAEPPAEGAVLEGEKNVPNQ